MTKNKYISYRIYTTPSKPTEHGEYVARCPIYEQARGFCELGAKRGKSYFIKGVTPSGEEIMIL